MLAWYDVHARTLPWRYKPGVKADPYRVWLSEIMLQQTTVAAVKPYFERFLARWPTVSDLAAAPVEDVMQEWAGLGYYSRARNLHAAAKAVVERHGGQFPASEAQLRELPGIGAYTAAAVAAIGFGLKATPLDGNIERVTARVHAVETPLPAAKPELKVLATAMTPDERAGDFAQALMDLGATICTPRSPVCALCPLNQDCEGFRLGIVDTLPRKAPKAARPERRGSAFVVISDKSNVLLRRRPPKGLLGGMLEVPSSPWVEGEPALNLADAPVRANWEKSPVQATHGFTHFGLTLDVYVTRGHAEEGVAGVWWPLETIAEAGLPTVMRGILDAAAADDELRPGRRSGGRGGRRSR